MTDADLLRAAGLRRVGDGRHHIVCRACGAVADVDCVVGRAPCLERATEAGFAIDEAEVTFWGLCPRCRASTGAPRAPQRPGDDPIHRRG
jgi:Fur family transcriptional regulator, stress-responsive regulator